MCVTLHVIQLAVVLTAGQAPICACAMPTAAGRAAEIMRYDGHLVGGCTEHCWAGVQFFSAWPCPASNAASSLLHMPGMCIFCMAWWLVPVLTQDCN